MQMLRGRADKFNVRHYKLPPSYSQSPSRALPLALLLYLPPHGASASARFLFAFRVGAAQRQQADDEYVT